MSRMKKNWSDLSLTFAAVWITLVLVVPISTGFDLEHLFTFTARKAEQKVDQLLSRCYGEYGCFTLGGKFVSMTRPVNLFPFAPETINTKLSLYTRKNLDHPYLLTPNDVNGLNKTHFNVSMPTKFIVHGFLEGGQQSWCLNMKDELLIYDDYNVIIVDWSIGALPPYTQSVANARLVGAILGKLLDLLKIHYDYSPQWSHIIGHSLGAHIAGYAGARVGNLGRISGLDPAGPYFEGTDPVVRLDTSDADFVDVIHTDGSSLLNKAFGMYNPTGHVDFYPNGGVKQPGCEDTVVEALEREDMNLYRGFRHWVACRHVRAHEYFTESINSACSFRGYECNSYDEFLRGLCTSCGPYGKSCAHMGFHSDRYKEIHQGSSATLRFFLKTNADPPFCTSHQVVTLHTAKRRIDSTDEPLPGILLMQIDGDKPLSEYAELNNKKINFDAGMTYSVVLSSRIDGPLRRIHLQMLQQPTSFTNQLARMFKKEPELEIQSVDVENLETRQVARFCSGENKLLKNGLTLTLRPTSRC